eukprot:TRINITY_DN786_c0_g4_i1.p1 TRINITY_DN786_c0_g4~~TRINITY_DN786_c0_g4_i1.p1  ORF type:complete len:354 (+),score=59.19 TRINITY_DN786_c0_g4_i1:976-2037(+)
MWRRGPNGKGTLCNACGVRWSLTKNKKETKNVKHEKDTPTRRTSNEKKRKLIGRNEASFADEESDSPGSNRYKKGYLRDRHKKRPQKSNRRRRLSYDSSEDDQEEDEDDDEEEVPTPSRSNKKRDGFSNKKSLSKDDHAAIVEIRAELRKLRNILDEKEKNGEGVISNMRLDVLSQLQGARISAEVKLGEMKIELDNDFASKREESLNHLVEIETQLECIKKLLEADKQTISTLQDIENRDLTISQVDKLLCTITSRFSSRAENLRKAWGNNESTFESIRKMVVDSLIAAEKELCETLQLKKGSMKSEFDDIRHRLTFLEKCLENGLLDLSVKQTTTPTVTTTTAVSELAKVD